MIIAMLCPRHPHRAWVKVGRLDVGTMNVIAVDMGNQQAHCGWLGDRCI